jgi:elongation factor P--beta-lysine ligase
MNVGRSLPMCGSTPMVNSSRDTLLQLLFTMGVEPHIGKDRPTFIYHFPATQAYRRYCSDPASPRLRAAALYRQRAGQYPDDAGTPADRRGHHNPEFTMLEWYRPCYDMYRLINEVDDLLQQVLESTSLIRRYMS